MLLKEPIEDFLGIGTYHHEDIVFSYSFLFPHWLLNTFFGIVSGIAVTLALVGCARFWRAMKAAAPRHHVAAPAMSMGASIATVLKHVILHDKFDECTHSKSRGVSHLFVVFGFVALVLAVIWMVTARFNPLVVIDFKYPLAFLNPWKMLANVGGLAILAGCIMMIRHRILGAARNGIGGYFDWSLMVSVLIVALTGFAAEIMHYLRLEPHRHVVYFVHLVFVCTLLMYLPYSKLAHLFYRSTAMVFAARYGWQWGAGSAPARTRTAREREETDHVGNLAAE